MNTREFLKTTAIAAAGIPFLGYSGSRQSSSLTINLNEVRELFLQHFNKLRDTEGPYGCYRPDFNKGTTLNASYKVAICRSIMGEDYKATLTDVQREEWIHHINSYARRNYPSQADCSYADNNHPLYTNAFIVASLGILGGKQRYPNRLYDDFNTEQKAKEWLTKLDWSIQWRTTHLLWGGLTYFSFSKNCPEGWINSVINWLDNAIDGNTGWWNKNISNKDRHQALGGSALTLPIYQHNKRRFPYPEKLIDSIIESQLPNGRWLKTKNKHVMNPLEYDVLYTLELMKKTVPNYRKNEIIAAIQKYLNLCLEYWGNYKEEYFRTDVNQHIWLLGIFSILKRTNPEQIKGGDNWTDIFSDNKFYRTDLVEIM